MKNLVFLSGTNGENVENDERSGRPKSHRTDENVEKVRNLVHSDRRLRIRAMAVKLD
jgi:hypothetical protein